MTELLQRQIANALWPHLVHRRWRGPRSTRKLSDHGQGQTFHPVCTAQIPKAPSMNDTITQTEAGAISVQTDTHHVVLFEEHYDRIIARAPETMRDDWRDAMDPRNGVPNPYTTDGRARTWDPFLTEGVYFMLRALVEAATVWPLHHDTPLELIRDEEVKPDETPCTTTLAFS